MISLREKLTAEPGFKYIVDNMELMSAAGHRRMLQQPFLTDKVAIEKEYDNTEAVMARIADDGCRQEVATLRHQLMQMHDLQGTLDNLGRYMTLDEIELFELKNFAHLCRKAAKATVALGIDRIMSIPDTIDVFSILDPDGTGIPNFYIYDSYHPDLPALRRQLKALQTRIDSGRDDDADTQRQINELLDRQNAIQQQVIADLSHKLAPYQPTLQEAHDRMAYADFLLAKTTLSYQWQLRRPAINGGDKPHTEYKGLWNPRLMHRNKEMGLRYQPVDISLDKGVCLITGANMAGKTVLLKTVGTSQLLAQFGLFVPAQSASLSIVQDVAFCIGDEQNEMNGLSSFASEITKISATTTRAESSDMLILIDEPARTTNPVEGKAIVQAVASLLDTFKSITLITTHYSQLALPCRRLRVRGFVEEMANVQLSPDNINRFMDYSLLPDSSDDVPQEALRIATILGCNGKVLDLAYKFLHCQSPDDSTGCS